MKNLIKKTILISGLAGIVSSCNDEKGPISKDFNKDGILDVLVHNGRNTLPLERNLFLSNLADSSFTKYTETYFNDSILIFLNENNEEYVLYKRDLEDKK